MIEEGGYEISSLVESRRFEVVRSTTTAQLPLRYFVAQKGVTSLCLSPFGRHVFMLDDS